MGTGLPFYVLGSLGEILLAADWSQGKCLGHGRKPFFFTSVGLGKTGKGGTRERTGPAERAHPPGETGTARPQIRSQGSYEGDLAERKPAPGVSGSAPELLEKLPGAPLEM